MNNYLSLYYAGSITGSITNSFVVFINVIYIKFISPTMAANTDGIDRYLQRHKNAKKETHTDTCMHVMIM